MLKYSLLVGFILSLPTQHGRQVERVRTNRIVVTNRDRGKRILGQVSRFVDVESVHRRTVPFQDYVVRQKYGQRKGSDQHACPIDPDNTNAIDMTYLRTHRYFS